MCDMHCLFCAADGPFTTIEHVIPESLGNDDLLLEGEVCDGCQRYFGSSIEQYVLAKSPIAAWRVMLGTTTKKGKRPKADLSQPKEQRGVLPRVHDRHDNIAIESMDDESVALTLSDDGVLKEVLSGQRSRFQIVLSPYMLHMMGRFLCKIGVELLCVADSVEARHGQFDEARVYARQGSMAWLWPILHYQEGSLNQLKQWRHDDKGWLVEAECYTYWLGQVNQHRVFEFGIGIDRYVITLDGPFSRLLLETQEANPGTQVLWYPPEAYRRR